MPYAIDCIVKSGNGPPSNRGKTDQSFMDDPITPLLPIDSKMVDPFHKL